MAACYPGYLCGLWRGQTIDALAGLRLRVALWLGSGLVTRNLRDLFRRHRRLVAAVTALAAVGGLAAGLTTSFASADTSGQQYVVSCSAAETVTPALNTNLIANPDAQNYTLFSVSGRSIGLPDCWTVSSPLPAPASVIAADGRGGVPGVVGTESFGGTFFATAISDQSSTATQLIDLSSLGDITGQPFEVSGNFGGLTNNDALCSLTVTWLDANGDTVGTATAGPVTSAQRDDITEALPQAWYGTVPAGATQAIVTLSESETGSHTEIYGIADQLNLTIGSSAAPSGPVLQTLPYNSSAGTETGTHIDPGTGLPVPNVVEGSLYRPAGVSAGNGTAYVSNTGDNVVASITNGETSIVAGSLEGHGETGDGGPATSATLNQPAGTAVDAKGDVFIADGADNTVREITPDGTIKRIAGTGFAGRGAVGLSPLGSPATRTPLDQPESVAVNAAGDVFIADTYNNRVVEVTPAGREFLVAGTGRVGYSGDGGPAVHARLNTPTGVAVDAQGNLYIADSGNNVIRRVDAKTGIITTVAGNYADTVANGGVGGYSGDGGPATSAQLNDPQGVAVDGAGDLFIADTFNNAIREVTPDGTISTVVNSSVGGAIPAAGPESSGAVPTASGLNTPYAVAVDPSTSTLYIADTGNDEVAEVLGLAQPGTAAGPTAG